MNSPNKLKVTLNASDPAMDLVLLFSQAKKKRWKSAYKQFKTMNLSQYHRYQWKSQNLLCFCAFLLMFVWFTRNDLAQRGPTTSDLESISQKRDHSRDTSNKIM